MSELADRPLRVKEENLFLHWWRMLRWFGNLRLVPRWREADSRLLLRALRRYFHDGLTRPGKIIFICSLLTFLFSYRSNSNLYLTTAALGFSLLAVSVLLGFVYRPRVRVTRQVPCSGVAGQPLQSRITIFNGSRRPLHNYTIREMVIPDGRWPREWARPHRQELLAACQETLTVSFIPRKRGRYVLSGVAVQSYFPLFLTRFTQRLAAPAEVFVLPAVLATPVPSLRKVADQATKRLHLGSDSTRKGPALEYSHSREFETGDSLRRLDHRASSRLAKPMTKIYEGSEEIRRDQVYLIVDVSLREFLRWQRRPVNATPLDRRLSLAVEIGRSAQNEGFTLNALALGATWQLLGNDQEFDQLIACAAPARPPEQAWPEALATLPDTLLNDNGLHILVLGRWTEQARALVERCLQAGVLILVFLLPESDDDVESLPAGPHFVEIQASEALAEAPL